MGPLASFISCRSGRPQRVRRVRQRRIGHLTGDDVEAALRALFEQHGRSCRFHFVCGARCFGKACHGQALVVDLAALVIYG
jgi:hypothetical protein